MFGALAGGVWTPPVPLTTSGWSDLLALLALPVAAELTLNANLHSWAEVSGSAGLSSGEPARIAYTPVSTTPVHQPNGVTVAAAGLAGIVAILALMLGLVVLSFASFFLLGIPVVILVAGVGAMWGTQLGFGFSAPLQPWFAGAGGVVLLALALNTGAALPIYWSLVFGSGRRLDRLREAWSNYWALFRGLVIPSCALFGVVVFRLLASG